MALTNAFYEAVQAGNVSRVRIMMQDSMLVDPTFDEFHAMEKAAASMDGLYDEHDGKEFVEDKSLWDDEYMDQVMVKVLSNFSYERLDHLKDVVRYLRPVERKVIAKTETPAVNHSYSNAPGSYKEEKRRAQENGDYLGVKIGTGAVIGAVVGGAIATVAEATTIGTVAGVVAGAAAGAATVAVIANIGEKNE